MTYGSPARTPARESRPGLYRAGRGRRVLLGAVLALLLADAAFVAAGHLLNDAGRVMGAPGLPLEGRRGPGEVGRSHGTTISWPEHGQAAFVLGDGRPAASPHQHPAPIASLAKVMTAYLTLERYPLSSGQDGFTITVTEGQERAAAEDAARGQSVVAVRAGEQLSERQLLEALLIPSGNNIAQLLAAVVAGSETRFLAQMNAESRALGMPSTAYTDPSGFDPGTVSTAADQLRVFRRAMRFPVFREIVSMADVTLPAVGTLRNFNPLVAAGYGGKTGSDSAAGGCLAFFTDVTVGGRPRTAVGVVMGQGEGSDTSAILAAAGEAAERLVGSVTPARRVRSMPLPGAPPGA